MKAYRKYLTIQDPKRVVLSDLPFHSGQQVEVLFFPKDNELNSHAEELQTLFKSTQELSTSKAISEEEIAKEIEAYRREH